MLQFFFIASGRDEREASKDENGEGGNTRNGKDIFDEGVEEGGKSHVVTAKRLGGRVNVGEVFSEDGFDELHVYIL